MREAKAEVCHDCGDAGGCGQIGKQFKKLDVLPISNYDVLTFQTLLFALRLLVGEMRNLWEAVLQLLQVEALHQRK
jgi:hypothetical protein